LKDKEHWNQFQIRHSGFHFLDLETPISLERTHPTSLASFLLMRKHLVSLSPLRGRHTTPLPFEWKPGGFSEGERIKVGGEFFNLT